MTSPPPSGPTSQDLIDALVEQRNRAWDTAAFWEARYKAYLRAHPDPEPVALEPVPAVSDTDLSTPEADAQVE